MHFQGHARERTHARAHIHTHTHITRTYDLFTPFKNSLNDLREIQSIWIQAHTYITFMHESRIHVHAHTDARTHAHTRSHMHRDPRGHVSIWLSPRYPLLAIVGWPEIFAVDDDVVD